MNSLRKILSSIIGLVFLLSSVLKLMDPVGTGLIVESYCKFLHLGFFLPYSKVLGIILSMTEGITAIALLSGVWRKVTAIVTFVLLGFFTAISVLLVVLNPSMDCGCFGQAISLTHEQTLYKNIFLLIFAFTAFIPLKVPAHDSSRRYVSFAIGTVLLNVFMAISAANIPIVDFSEFKPSHSIVLEDELAGEHNEYPTLMLLNEFGEDCSADILDDKVVLISVYAPEQLDNRQRLKLTAFAQEAFDAGFRPVVVSAGSVDIPGVEMYYADSRKLMTLNRSNGGVVFLDDGFIMRKRSARLLMSFDKMQEMAANDSTEIYVAAAIQRSLLFQLFLFVFIALLLLL